MNDFIDEVILGGCLEVLKEIPDNSVVTDLSYGFAFMGKGWDNFGTDYQKYKEGE
jgi:DNA modification methylase